MLITLLVLAAILATFGLLIFGMGEVTIEPEK